MKKHTRHRYLVIFLCFILIFILNSCIKNEKAVVANDRNGKWINDIDFLSEQLPKKHKNLFFKLKEEDFNKEIKNIKNKVRTNTDEELKVELSKIIALIGDGHTRLYPDLSKLYPIKFYWFKEGIYAVDATENYKSIVNLQLKKINGENLEEVLNAIKPVISQENEAQVKNLSVKYLTIPEILKGLKIANSNSVNMTFVDHNGKEVNINVKEENSNKIKYISQLRAGEDLPLYLNNKDKSYWYKYIKKNNTIYFKYNECKNMDDQSFKQFNKEMFDVIDHNKVDKIIVDLRDNGGGNSSIMTPFLKEIKKREDLNKKDKLYVVIGRKTFSSALLNALDLKNDTNATLIGEPTGGKPNHYGEVKELVLNNTGIIISYSVKYFENSKEDTASLMPDINIEPSIEDYINKKDAVLDKIFSK